MKYIDRYAYALELYLLQNASFLADVADVPSGSMDARLSALPSHVRSLMSKLLSLVLRNLADEHPEAYSHIPSEISERFSKEQKNDISSSDRLLRFAEWFSGLHTKNEQARINRLAELSNFASRISSPELAGAADSFLSLDNQRVMIRLESGENDSTVLISSAEREWGQLVFRFDGCTELEGFSCSMPGYMCGFEGIVSPDGSRRVNILLDSSFADSADAEHIDRMLSSDHWQELSFSCSGFSLEPRFYDYAGRMQRLGTPRFELAERCCALLVNKYELLGGDGSMTAAERLFLPTACFLDGGYRLIYPVENDTDRQCRELIAGALDNRSAMRSFAALLKKCRRDKLCSLLDRAVEQFENDSLFGAADAAKKFYRQLEKEVSTGAARPLLAELSEQLGGMTADFTGDAYRAPCELAMLDKLRDITAPELERMGFSGDFPHFFRRRGKHIDYLSFMLDTNNFKPHHGKVSYFATVAAAQLPSSACGTLSGMGISPEQTNALDCLPEADGISHYGELAGEDDCQYVRIDVDLFRSSGSITRDESDRLPSYLNIAEHQFRRGRLPIRYRRLRRRMGRRNSGALLRSINECLPIGVIVVLGLLLAYRFYFAAQPYYSFSASQSAALAVTGGFVATLFAAFVRKWRLSRRLWRF